MQLRLATPLQEANVNTALLNQDLVLYAKQYVNLVDPYKVVWWKVERCFLQLKLTCPPIECTS